MGSSAHNRVGKMGQAFALAHLLSGEGWSFVQGQLLQRIENHFEDLQPIFCHGSALPSHSSAC